ncbi:MAG: DUF1592 domain-containing protein [Myxococcota bacterium]
MRTLFLLALVACKSAAVPDSVDTDTPVEVPPTPPPIDPGDCVSDAEQFEISVSPILQGDCISCHVVGGIAEATRHVLHPSTEADHLTHNREVLRPLALEQLDGSSLLVQKALGQAGHGGGVRVALDSPEHDALRELVARFVTPDECDVEVPVETPDVPPSPMRRLTESQLRNTVADLFPGVDLPTFEVVNDPLVHGYDNNASVQAPTALLISEIRDMSLAVTTAAMDDPAAWITCDLDLPDTPCIHDFLLDFGDRAFRRPLTTDEETVFIGFYDAMEALDGDPRAALQLTLQAYLNSGPFLYLPEYGTDPAALPGERVALSDYEMASRLSYFLWNSMPDDALMTAAENGELATEAGIEVQAWRMLADPRAEQSVANFHRLWLELDEIAHIAPDPATYPQWEAGMAEAARDEVDALIWASAFGPTPTLDHLLLDRTTSGDPQLATLYGTGGTELSAAERAGFFTRVGWLGATSHPVYASPIQRGVFVLERMLCVPPPAPPANINTTLPEDDPVDIVTNRDRYEAHSTNPTCFGCHESIDGIGFGFENYDGVGVYRTVDNGEPVDASGQFVTGDLDGTAYEGGVALSTLLAGSESVHACVTRQWYRYALGRSDAPGDEATLADLSAAYWGTGGELPQLLVDIARTESFRTRRAE